MNKYAEQAKAARRERRKNRMCLSKVRYDNEADAYQKGQRSYHCPHCHGWHRSGQLAELISTVKRKVC